MRGWLASISQDESRCMLIAIQTANSGSSVSVWEHPQIATAAYGHDLILRQLHGRDWNLLNRSRRGLDHMRMPVETRDSITVMGDWIDAGILRKAFTCKDFWCPKRFGRNGITRSAVRPWRYTAGILNCRDGPAGVS